MKLVDDRFMCAMTVVFSEVIFFFLKVIFVALHK